MIEIAENWMKLGDSYLGRQPNLGRQDEDRLLNLKVKKTNSQRCPSCESERIHHGVFGWVLRLKQRYREVQFFKCLSFTTILLD